jgi:hypothetical protein
VVEGSGQSLRIWQTLNRKAVHERILVIGDPEEISAQEVLAVVGAPDGVHVRGHAEYWTYTLPRRVGTQEAARLTSACLPVSPASALSSGLVDRVIAGDAADYRAGGDPGRGAGRQPRLPARLAGKGRQLAAAEKQRPLAAYRAAELAIMRRNFSGPHEPYPELRRAFVYKEKPGRTPSHLAPAPDSPMGRPGETRAPQTVRVAAS